MAINSIAKSIGKTKCQRRTVVARIEALSASTSYPEFEFSSGSAVEQKIGIRVLALGTLRDPRESAR
jgi:hypothetical protein